MDVATFCRDPPGSPRNSSAFERYDGGSYRGPGIYLVWNNRDPHLNIWKGASRFIFATFIRHAIDRMLRALEIEELS